MGLFGPTSEDLGSVGEGENGIASSWDEAEMDGFAFSHSWAGP